MSINTLFKGANSAGNIGDASMQVLNIPDLGAQIQAGLGVSIDDITTSEVTLVTVLVDDSGSLRQFEQIVRDGVNLIAESLRASKQKAGILMGVRYLNGKVLTPYVSLDQVPLLDSSNYAATGSTPLYDQSVVICGQVIAKTEEFENGGVAVRSVTVILTDGADYGSRHSRASDVAKIVGDMYKTETHIVIGVGIDDGYTDFMGVFQSMGIEPKWVLTPGKSASEIRKAFQVVSQSAVRASQGAGAFSKTATTGFTS